MNVGERIKNAREKNGITQEELASRLGLAGKSSVSKVESAGDNISTKSIRNYANALGVSVASLMGWDCESYLNASLDLSQLTRENQARIYQYYFKLLELQNMENEEPEK